MEWHVWDTEYPDEGSHVVEADSREAALLLFADATGCRGIVEYLTASQCGPDCPCKSAPEAE